MLNLLRLRDLFIVSIAYEGEHRPFVFFKERPNELFPDVDIPSLSRLLACNDFMGWDPRLFKSTIGWLRAGRLDPLSRNDEVAKQQLNDYLYLYHIVADMKLPTVQNHIVDVIKARKTCHEGWFDASLVSYVYNVTRLGDGLRRYLIDSFVYKSYQQVKHDTTAEAYWSTRRSTVLSENMDEGNKEFVTDQADAVAAAEMIQDPYTRSACHYHNHASGFNCPLSLKRKRANSTDDSVVPSRRRS